MTTLVQAADAIVSRWNTQWASATPTVYDGEAYRPTPGTSFVRLVIRHERSNQDTLGPIGNRKFLRGGRIFATIYAPRDRGRGAIDALAHAAIGVFEGLKFDGVWVTRALPREIGEDGTWRIVTIEFDFTYEETK